MYEIHYTTTNSFYFFPHAKEAYLPAWVLQGKNS